MSVVSTGLAGLCVATYSTVFNDVLVCAMCHSHTTRWFIYINIWAKRYYIVPNLMRNVCLYFSVIWRRPHSGWRMCMIQLTTSTSDKTVWNEVCGYPVIYSKHLILYCHLVTSLCTPHNYGISILLYPTNQKHYRYVQDISWYGYMIPSHMAGVPC